MTWWEMCPFLEWVNWLDLPLKPSSTLEFLGDMNCEFSPTHAWDPVLSSNQMLHFFVHLATGWIVSLSAQKLSQNGKNQVMHPQLALHSHELLATDGMGGTLSNTNDNAI